MLLNDNLLPGSFSSALYTSWAVHDCFIIISLISEVLFLWAVLSAQLGLATQIYIHVFMCASFCQLKSHFDLSVGLVACITARCILFKINVSRYGSVNEH